MSAAKCSDGQPLLPDVQVDPEQQERPEEDREHRGSDRANGVEMLEVVVRGGDRDAHYEVNDPEQARPGAAAVEAAFKARDLETTLLRGPARDKALKEYGSGRWYGAAEVDRLSEREAQVIATRLVNRAKPHLGLDEEKLAAFTKDFAAGIAAVGATIAGR